MPVASSTVPTPIATSTQCPANFPKGCDEAKRLWCGNKEPPNPRSRGGSKAVCEDTVPASKFSSEFCAVVPGTAGRILRRTLDFVISELCALGYLLTKISFDKFVLEPNTGTIFKRTNMYMYLKEDINKLPLLTEEDNDYISNDELASLIMVDVEKTIKKMGIDLV